MNERVSERNEQKHANRVAARLDGGADSGFGSVHTLLYFYHIIKCLTILNCYIKKERKKRWCVGLFYWKILSIYGVPSS